MLLAGVTRWAEGAVGNDLLSGWAAANAAQTSTPECSGRKRDVPDTHCLPPLPPLHCQHNTRDYTHLRLADRELGIFKIMFFSTLLILVFSVSSFCLRLPYSHLFSLYSLHSLTPKALSLSLSPLLLLKQGIITSCIWITCWKVLKKLTCILEVKLPSDSLHFIRDQIKTQISIFFFIF